MEAVLEAFLSTGIPGATAAALAYVVYHLWGEGKKEREEHKKERDGMTAQVREVESRRLEDIKALYQMRVADSEMIHKQMLEVVKQCTTVLESTASSLDGHKGATIEHRDAQKEAAEELRKLSTLLVTLNEEIKLRLRAPGR